MSSKKNGDISINIGFFLIFLSVDTYGFQVLEAAVDKLALDDLKLFLFGIDIDESEINFNG